MSTIGKNIKLTIFGESHGDFIGCVLDGIGPGYEIDEKNIKNLLILFGRLQIFVKFAA